MWFDRPGSSQNSLDLASLEGLDEAIGVIEADTSARGVVLRSGKPKGFCAGADLRQIAACRDEGTMPAFCRRGMEVFDRLSTLPVPTTAVLHGVALGGGLELALACRSRIALDAEPAATIGTPEVKLGLVPGWDAIGALPRLVGLENALRLLLGGEPIGAGEAKRIGLVDALATRDDLDEAIGSTWRIGPRPAIEPSEDWPARLAEARCEPTSRAKLRLIDILDIESSRGPEAGRDAAVAGLTELTNSPEARAALDAFLGRAAHA